MRLVIIGRSYQEAFEEKCMSLAVKPIASYISSRESFTYVRSLRRLEPHRSSLGFISVHTAVPESSTLRIGTRKGARRWPFTRRPHSEPRAKQRVCHVGKRRAAWVFLVRLTPIFASFIFSGRDRALSLSHVSASQLGKLEMETQTIPAQNRYS